PVRWVARSVTSGVRWSVMAAIVGPSGTRHTDAMAMTHSPIPAALAAHLPTGLLVGGAWRPAQDGGTFAVHDPATGAELFDVADATPADGLDALAAADEALPAWRAVAPRERS